MWDMPIGIGEVEAHVLSARGILQRLYVNPYEDASLSHTGRPSQDHLSSSRASKVQDSHAGYQAYCKQAARVAIPCSGIDKAKVCCLYSSILPPAPPPLAVPLSMSISTSLLRCAVSMDQQAMVAETTRLEEAAVVLLQAFQVRICV